VLSSVSSGEERGVDGVDSETEDSKDEEFDERARLCIRMIGTCMVSSSSSDMVRLMTVASTLTLTSDSSTLGYRGLVGGKPENSAA
jgi:hypothetical protein